jgi:hypothetical protein
MCLRPLPEYGYSLLELLFVLGVTVTLSAIAVPQLLRSLDDYRTAGAVRYVTTRIQRIRMEAVSRSANTALEFIQTGSSYSYGSYMDGNGNGVGTADIRDGIDPAVGAIERLPDNFPGVEFGLLPGLPPVEAGSPPPGTDPIKLGASNLLSYSAAGSSTSGSIYILGRSRSQYVVRIFGDTGRTRVLRFDLLRRRWQPL